MKLGLISNKGSATVFDLPGQDSKRNLSPELPLQPYNPAVTSLVRSMRPAPRNPLYPFSNGLRQPNPSSRPSNSSPTFGILGGNPTLSSPVFHLALLPFGHCPNNSSIFCVKFGRTIFSSLSFCTDRLCRAPKDWVKMSFPWTYTQTKRLIGFFHWFGVGSIRFLVWSTHHKDFALSPFYCFSHRSVSQVLPNPPLSINCDLINEPHLWTTKHLFYPTFPASRLLSSLKSLGHCTPTEQRFLSWLNCFLFKQFIVSVNWSIYNLWNWPNKISRNTFIQFQCFTKSK